MKKMIVCAMTVVCALACSVKTADQFFDDPRVDIEWEEDGTYHEWTVHGLDTLIEYRDYL